MLDVIGSIFISAYVASILMLAFLRAETMGVLKPLTAALLVWLGGDVAIAAGAEHSAFAVHPNLVMFALSITLLAAAWVFAPAFRRAAAATSLEALVGLHAWRLGGIFFLLLYAANRLPGPFAPVAATGDMLAGAGAAALAIALLRGHRPSLQLIGMWNIFGLLDLVAAVSLALLATPGTAFQLFTDVPRHSAFTQFPWIAVPVAIVPSLFFIHLAIHLKLRGSRHDISAHPQPALL